MSRSPRRKARLIASLPNTHSIFLIARAVVIPAALSTSACIQHSPFEIGASADAELLALAGRARSGDKWSQYELGLRFERGSGVTANKKRALELYRLAAAATGGGTLVYVPAAGQHRAARVMRIDDKPVVPGLAVAEARIRELERRHP